MRRIHSLLPLTLAAYATVLSAQLPAATEWPAYGRDAGGSRFAPITQIDRKNVGRLTVAWTFHTGETEPGDRSFEATPILVDGTLYLSTPLGKILAVDPVTGTERWRFDAKVGVRSGFGDFTTRGVSTWRDARLAAGAACARRGMDSRRRGEAPGRVGARLPPGRRGRAACPRCGRRPGRGLAAAHE